VPPGRGRLVFPTHVHHVVSVSSRRSLSAVVRSQLNLFVLSCSLFVQVHLDATLSGLALVVQILVFGLLGSVTGQGRYGTTNSTLSTVANSLSEVAQLTLGFLALTLKVLVTTLLLETLASDQVADSLFGTTNCLIPLTLSAVGAVLCRGTRRADSERTGFGSSVGEVGLDRALILVLVGFGLVASATGHSGNTRLYITSGGVNSSLERRGVIVGRHFVGRIEVVGWVGLGLDGFLWWYQYVE